MKHSVLLVLILFACRQDPSPKGHSEASAKNDCTGITNESRSDWSVTGSSLRIRDEPTVSGKVIGTVLRGTRVEELERSPGLYEIDKRIAPWVKIRTQTGERGWVFGGYLSLFDLGDSRTLASLALKAETTSPQLAEELYRAVGANPENRSGLESNCNELARERLNILSCQREHSSAKPRTMPKPLAEAVHAAFLAEDAPALAKLAQCDTWFGRCNSDGFFIPSRSALIQSVKKAGTPGPYSTPTWAFQSDHAELAFSSKDGTLYGIHLRKRANGWVWDGFCTSPPR